MKYAILLATLLFLSVCTAATWVSPIDEKYQSKSPKLYQMFVESRSLLDSHRGDRAVLVAAKEKLDFILSEDSKFAPAYREYARLYMKAGHISSGNYPKGVLVSSEAALLEAIRIEPDYADSFVLLGYLYTRKKLYDQAEKALIKAGEIGTELPWYHLNYAALLKRTGRLDQALSHYMAVVNSETDNRNAYSSALSGTAFYYQIAQNLPEAEKWFLKYAEYDQSAWGWGEHSRFMTFNMRDFDQGIESGEKSLSLMSYGIGHLNLACAYYGKWYELRESNPVKSKAYYEKAYALFSDTEEAVRELSLYKATRDVAKELHKYSANPTL